MKDKSTLPWSSTDLTMCILDSLSSGLYWHACFLYKKQQQSNENCEGMRGGGGGVFACLFFSIPTVGWVGVQALSKHVHESVRGQAYKMP